MGAWLVQAGGQTTDLTIRWWEVKSGKEQWCTGQTGPTWWCKRQPNNASTNLNTDGPGSWKTLICPGTNNDAAHVFMESMSEFSCLFSNTNECRGEAAGLFKGMTSSHNPAQWQLYLTRLYMRHFRKLKMPWFKIVKIVGQGDFNDHNQWSFSMIKCKSSSISSSRISLLSVCGVQVIKKVIKENERRLEETVRNHSFAAMSQRGGGFNYIINLLHEFT